ncbi:hypothetical protein AN403_5550 [Pseudomonas fluorescens]|uniref:Uncharacterized protein n=1 Tax=Pseudomonas fluorescens TaxID=294 RepID=A0A0P8X585_PSEFL|nr:hypothetical protein AN403_5550 [Pseudomonas fluorescens]
MPGIGHRDAEETPSQDQKLAATINVLNLLSRQTQAAVGEVVVVATRRDARQSMVCCGGTGNYINGITTQGQMRGTVGSIRDAPDRAPVLG